MIHEERTLPFLHSRRCTEKSGVQNNQQQEIEKVNHLHRKASSLLAGLAISYLRRDDLDISLSRPFPLPTASGSPHVSALYVPSARREQPQRSRTCQGKHVSVCPHGSLTLGKRAVHDNKKKLVGTRIYGTVGSGRHICTEGSAVLLVLV